MKTLQDVRSTFLNYFGDNDHEIVDSSPLVPHNDPTLLFTNAGMVQFKDIFTGKESRDYSRAVTSQKCVRAGGKHNDLENVGYTARHHTFFEMLGNFSFGDYFKEEAIAFAWELVTKEFGLPKDKLLVTVFHEDEEAVKFWKKVAGLSDDKIIRIATSDNFWSMGDTGPCGPCTEIFYDHGPDIPGGPPGSPDEDGDRFIEIWNLVFMQYEQQAGGSRIDLPSQSIDTGMGLERMTAILQGKHNNYEIDLFEDLIASVAQETSQKPEGEALNSMRVISDHLRSSAFLVADGVLPSNEGRGYVLRRIMRRAMRHGHLLGARDPLMHKLVPTLTSLMGEAYPELKRAQSTIEDNLEREEKRFKVTLENGLKILDDAMDALPEGGTLDGETAFKLYDTHGFPLDLTADVLRRKGMTVDETGFDKEMEKQREQARANWSGGDDTTTEKVWFDIRQELGQGTQFLGYDELSTEAKILAIVKDGKQVKRAKSGDSVQIIADKTPFYAESGGQIGDVGVIDSDQSIAVRNVTKKAGDLFVHHCQVLSGEYKVGETKEFAVSGAVRKSVERNHSATHLLHEALRQVLGDHVAQKGSLQDDTRTRFDISQPEPITPAQIKEIEAIVRREIRNNTTVQTDVLPLEEARASGARALFGEKYDDEVRVVSMGSTGEDGKPFSIELCGGTHVKQTGEIGAFKIVSEGGVSAGVRRVEAVTGEAAEAVINKAEELIHDLSDTLKSPTNQLKEKIESLLSERKEMQKEISDLRKKLATGGGDNDDIETVGNVKFIGKVMVDIPPGELKPMADALKQKVGSGVVVLVSSNEGKASIVVGVTDDLTDNIDAVKLVRAGAEALGGKGGGGRPDMAQAGGSDPSGGEKAISVIKDAVA